MSVRGKWAATVAVVPLALALLLAACDDDGGAPPESTPARTPPADPAARFQELAVAKEAARFHIVYSLDTGYDVEEEEFAWLQDGRRVRWEKASTRRGHISGTSSIDDGTGNGLACVWGTLGENAIADVVCAPNPHGWGVYFLDVALSDYFRFPEFVQFDGYGRILGTDVDCFRADSLRMRGRICLSGEGLPLEVESVVGTGSNVYRYSLRAVDTRPPPSEEDLLTPVVPAAPLGKEQDFRGVPVADLVLPDMPIIEDFFSEEEE